MGVLDEFFPFDLGFGYPANTTRWRKMAQLWQSDGVYGGYLNQLSAALAGTTVTVQSGGLFIHGYYGEVQNPQSLTGIGTNGTVVAGVDLVNQSVSIYYRDQVVDYGPNATTNFAQNANTWEIPLWLVSGSTLIDLRTMITPAAGTGWWATAAGPVSISPAQTIQTNLLTLRIPYTGKVLIRGELLVTFSDASQIQSAICQLTYQFGQSDVQATPTITPGIPGGGPASTPVAVPVALSAQVPVTQGKKTVGWRVTAGLGPLMNLTTLTASATMLNQPAAA